MENNGPLSPAEMASLTAIGAGSVPVANPIPIAHLAVLLRRGFILADYDRYKVTPSGLFQIAHEV
jgi:hypothetical protein